MSKLGQTDLKAPWSEVQVKSLNDFQSSGYLHPYTCNDGHDLIATKDGWICKECQAKGKSYHQDWCYHWMADDSWRKGFEESKRLYCDPRVQKLLATLKNI